ncbi:MAG TPA: lysozyme inhibitor LprI family protein [Flavobacteriales bacterium]|nr:lysozyme inhibitor LprI family protein [Flavobacteriales bacterium]
MKKILLIAALCFSGTCFSQSQAELNQQAHAAFKKADAELNSIYQKILTNYKEDKEFIKNLKATQRIWITFRDAELKMKYPDRKEPMHYGSIHPMCVSLYLEKLTLERIATLKLWAEGAEEGDGCGGSEHVK